MGLMSFTDAEDKKRSIVLDSYDHPDSGLNCYLLQPQNNATIEGVGYDGTANIGGVDVFDWLMKTNGLPSKKSAIDIFHNEVEYRKLLFPIKITHNKDAIYENVSASYVCEHQGLPLRPDKQEGYNAGIDLWIMDDEMYDDVDFSKPAEMLSGKILTVLLASVSQIKGFNELSMSDYDPEQEESSYNVSPEKQKMIMDIVLSNKDVVKILEENKDISNDDIVEVVQTISRSDGTYARDAFDDLVIIIKEKNPKLVDDTPEVARKNEVSNRRSI